MHFEYLAQVLGRSWVQKYQRLLDCIFTYCVLPVTPFVIESTGWWLKAGSVNPDCLGLHPGSIPY